MSSTGTREHPRRLSRVETAERRIQALRLRRAGVSYRQIADKLRYAGPNAASKDVYRALKEVQHEEGRVTIDLERERYDDLQAVLWARARGGDMAAARELIKLMARRAALLGLDARDRADEDPDGLEAAGSLIDGIAAGLRAQYKAGLLGDVPELDDETR